MSDSDERTQTRSDPGRPRIVVGVEDAPSAEAALRWAEVEGRIRGAEVHATMAAGMPLASYPLGWPSSAVDTESVHEGTVKHLDAIVDRVAERPEGIARHVQIGARGLGGFEGQLLGSVSHKVLLITSRPVVVVHGLSA